MSFCSRRRQADSNKKTKSAPLMRSRRLLPLPASYNSHRIAPSRLHRVVKPLKEVSVLHRTPACVRAYHTQKKREQASGCSQKYSVANQNISINSPALLMAGGKYLRCAVVVVFTHVNVLVKKLGRPAWHPWRRTGCQATFIVAKETTFRDRTHQRYRFARKLCP